MKKTVISIVALLSLSISIFGQSDKNQKDAKMDAFITDLMSKMTLDEKIGQLHLISGTDAVSGESVSDQSQLVQQIKNGQAGAMINAKGAEKVRTLQTMAVEQTRMKIPLMFGMDFLHGYETIFPLQLGLASSWNMEGIKQAAHIGAVEASADGLNWIYSPMVDISRDPRWGRVAEGAGEDPFLGGEVAKAMVKGYQGEPAYANNTNIMACMKHYALYGASEAGRDYNVVDMSRYRMMNEYMLPYKAAVEAGVGSVMSSFNEVDGVPATANRWLLQDVLRDSWGFDGFVVTDYASIGDIIRFKVADYYNAAVLALRAGTDLDMESYAYKTNLANALKKGDVTQEQIDTACRRMLEAKYKLGLFDNPYKYCDVSRPKKDIYTAEHRAAARKMATECFVLLKNENNILPLKKKGRIALIGPHGNNRPNMLGSWGWPSDLQKATTILEAMNEAVGDKAKVVYARGCHAFDDAQYEEIASLGKNFEKDPRTEAELLEEALRIAKDADVIVVALGESSEMSGESSSRTELDIPAPQKRLLKELVKTGKPMVLTLFAGRPMTISWENENVPAILNVWFGGSEGAFAICDVLFGDVNPSGKITSTWPLNVGQIPVYYNMKSVSKPMDKWPQKFRSGYLDVPNEPLYPFGYGLSYTKYDYSDVILSGATLKNNGQITASVTVTNSGKMDGYEVVQMYTHDLVASSTRPVKELKGFEKVFIKAGESKKVSFQITPEMLKFYNHDLQFIWEPGEFDLMIGCSSNDVKSARFTLVD